MHIILWAPDTLFILVQIWTKSCNFRNYVFKGERELTIIGHIAVFNTFSSWSNTGVAQLLLAVARKANFCEFALKRTSQETSWRHALQKLKKNRAFSNTVRFFPSTSYSHPLHHCSLKGSATFHPRPRALIQRLPTPQWQAWPPTEARPGSLFATPHCLF